MSPQAEKLKNEKHIVVQIVKSVNGFESSENSHVEIITVM